MRQIRSSTRIFCLFLLPLVLAACEAADNRQTFWSGGSGPQQEDDTSVADALAGYWEAQVDVAEALADLDPVWTQVTVALADPEADADAMTVLLDQYAVLCEIAAAEFDSLIALEDLIVPYGQSKTFFGEDDRAVVSDVYATARTSALASGQMLRTCWRVLGGFQTLRDALREADAGVPIVSTTTRRLQAHLAARDEAVAAAILAEESHGGLVPWSELDGATPAEREATYRALQGDDPWKLAARAGVHRWDAEERAATEATFFAVGRSQIAGYVNATSGSDALEDVADQMVSSDQERGPAGTVAWTVSDVNSAAPIATAMTVLVSKRGQPAGEEKVAALLDTESAMGLQLPPGVYDVVALAEDYLRGVATSVIVEDGGTAELPLALYERQSHAIILESVTSSDANASVGESVQLEAVAVSTTGSNLQFAWAAAGPVDPTVFGRSPDQTFVADEAGDYTVTLTVSDGAGNQATRTLAIEVLPLDAEVVDIEIRDGDFADGELNPGEDLELALLVEGGATGQLTGDATFSASGRAEVTGEATSTFSFPSGGGRTTWPVTVSLPADYDEPEAEFVFTFDNGDRVLTQTITLPVVFDAQLDAFPEFVTDRVLSVTGSVSNPSLATAYLSVNDDLDQLTTLRLNNGVFNQIIILEGSNDVQDVSLELVAECGSLRASDAASFRASFEPAGLRVTLAWDTDGTDVDLWVTDPFDERCYYANATTESGLDLDVDDVNGFGPENITCITPPAGTYVVQVHYYSDHDGEQALGTNVQVAVRLNEATDDEAIYYFEGFLSDTGDVWDVVEVTVGDKGRWQPVDSGPVSRYAGPPLPAKAP